MSNCNGNFVCVACWSKLKWKGISVLTVFAFLFHYTFSLCQQELRISNENKLQMEVLLLHSVFSLRLWFLYLFRERNWKTVLPSIGITSLWQHGFAVSHYYPKFFSAIKNNSYSVLYCGGLYCTDFFWAFWTDEHDLLAQLCECVVLQKQASKEVNSKQVDREVMVLSSTVFGDVNAGNLFVTSRFAASSLFSG